jgi:hypothetical protein
MTFHVAPCGEMERSVATGALLTGHVSPDAQDPAADLQAQLGTAPLAQVFVFAGNRQTLERMTRAAAQAFAGALISGCTTAGQIGRAGYEDDDVVVIGLPARHFAVASVVIEDLDALSPQDLIDRLVQKRVALTKSNPAKPNGFGFLLIDGLSLREDALAAAIAPAMGTWPVFGGSAGDGFRFRRTFVAQGDALYQNAAVLTFVATDYTPHVFTLDHLEPSDMRMVVTGADPERRIVKEINAEPAAREYARIVGKDPDQLDEFTFAAHPVVVRLGDTHHVRAIQRVNEAGELVFFAAIDEGMVLTTARASDLAGHLDRELSALAPKAGATMDVLACDCILRKIEASQMQATRQVSDVLARHRVVGFSTYGEQIGPIHVNHTMTGVALIGPGD